MATWPEQGIGSLALLFDCGDHEITKVLPRIWPEQARSVPNPRKNRLGMLKV